MNNTKKESLLIISYKIPYPLESGGAIAQFFFLKQLVNKYEVSFCTEISNENQKNHLLKLKNILPDLKIFMHQVVNKEVDFRSKTISKLFKYFKIIKGIIWPILSNIFTKKNIVTTPNILNNSFGYSNEGFTIFICEIFKSYTFDFVQLEFFESISLLPIIPVESKKIVILHEIRSKRNSLIKIPNPHYKKYLVDINKIIENSFLDLADSVVVFNEQDKEFLKDINSNVHVSPFGIPIELIEKEKASNYFNKFLFIGGENHYPNKEALEWFLEMVYIPNIDIITWPIHITGRWSSGFVRKYKNYPQICFTGFLGGFKNIYDNSVLISPILSGSGIRTKILQSFANKIPVVSTRFASEGLFENAIPPKHIIHFDTVSEFLNLFKNFENDMDYLKQTADDGYLYYTTYFNSKLLIEKRFEVYNLN